MIAVMIVPTGLGCSIGGHAGDSTPAAKLLASVCDKLIVHPNVVNASDINEMTENMLYVEGSILDRFLEGRIQLRPVSSNRILLVMNKPITNETINAINAARVTIGCEVKIAKLATPLVMKGWIKDGKADGSVTGWEDLCDQVDMYDFDALAIATQIFVDEEVSMNYYNNGGVNPWGAVEAKASKLIANSLNKPVAHAPVESDTSMASNISMEMPYSMLCDPRIAPEMISNAYLHCVLKGLHKAPRIGSGIDVDQVDCMISPMNCYGPPHNACEAKSIPIIYVEENKSTQKENLPGFNTHTNFIVKNYHEAVGIMAGIKIGVSRESVRRPIKKTEIIEL